MWQRTSDSQNFSTKSKLHSWLFQTAFRDEGTEA